MVPPEKFIIPAPVLLNTSVAKVAAKVIPPPTPNVPVVILKVAVSPVVPPTNLISPVTLSVAAFNWMETSPPDALVVFPLRVTAPETLIVPVPKQLIVERVATAFVGAVKTMEPAERLAFRLPESALKVNVWP